MQKNGVRRVTKFDERFKHYEWGKVRVTED